MGSQLPWGERSQWGNKKKHKGKKTGINRKKMDVTLKVDCCSKRATGGKAHMGTLIG